MATTAPSPSEAHSKRVLWPYAAGIVIAFLLPFVFWPSLLTNIGSSDFLAHRYCYLNNPKLVWSSVSADTVIAISYVAISITLATLVSRARREIPFSWMFLAFGLFIITCGGTHLMDAVTLWVPLYWLAIDIKIVTALASLATAVMLPSLVPKTLSLLNASKLAAERKLQLEEANALLLGRTQDATARLAAIVEGSEDAIIGCRLDGVITDWNEAATRLYGYSAEEAVGLNIAVTVPPDHMEELQRTLDEIAHGGRIQQFETVRKKKDGGLMHISFSAAPIADADGNVIGAARIERDMTSRIQMEEAIRRSEERFRLVTWATRDAISDWDMVSGGVWRSKSFWEQFGYEAKDVEPDLAELRKLVHPNDEPRVWQAFQSALARRDESCETEFRFRRADGSYAIVLGRSHIIYREDGTPVRAISAMTDLSERRELEEQFRQAQKMEAIGRLAGGIAHDFNNCLMIISSYAFMMEERIGSDERVRKDLQQVLKAADRAATLTQQLLAFSRKQVLSPRVLDLNAVVQDSVEMIKRLIGEDIELTVSLGTPLWAVKADPGQIVQTLMNLCVNARDAMQNGGKLFIETRNTYIDANTMAKKTELHSGNYTELKVRDSGTGMTGEVQAHLFEPFFTTKEVGRGTGLGLSTVYGIVKQSGGDILVNSELGQGSAFMIYFPAVEAPVEVSTIPDLGEAEGKGELVLLAEDEPALRESMCTYLTAHGYIVLQAADGEQALEIARQNAGYIRLLITDMILPKLTGSEISREVTKICPQVATLFISGYTDRALIDFDSGKTTATFLQKPFTLRTLLRTLREMLHG